MQGRLLEIFQLENDAQAFQRGGPERLPIVDREAAGDPDGVNACGIGELPFVSRHPMSEA